MVSPITWANLTVGETGKSMNAERFALEKQKFLVDTGASPSVVDQRSARRLGLVEAPGKLALLNRDVTAERAVLPRLQVGPVLVEFAPVLVRDLSVLEKALGVKIDAVIGLDELGWSNFTIDYERATNHFWHDPVIG